LPEAVNANGPVVILVPGGAFGTSKCWPSERFAQTADRLIEKYNATIVISVSPHPSEKQIAKEICASSRNKLINLGDRSLNPGELKALFSIAELVISNDTGPRHIAIALGRKVVSLFGPNDPAWTETDCKNEIQIVGNVYCGPCAKPKCKKSEHLCMSSITAEMVCKTAKELLEDKRRKAKVFSRQQFIETSKSFFIDSAHKAAFEEMGLTCIDAVFSFAAGKSLTKNNLAPFRSRLQFEINSPSTPLEVCAEGSSVPQEEPLLTGSTTLFLKRYETPPVSVQIRNWVSHRSRKSCSFLEFESANELAEAGISTPKIISYGQQWGRLFEKRSFVITEKIPNAESLERKLPDCFNGPATAENLKLRRNFIAQLADFVEKFHQKKFRHRDLYFSHIFHSDDGEFYLIDLARVFKPFFSRQRFRIKDIAQIHYSAPAKHFSNTDRLRFYLRYTGDKKLTTKDKIFIHQVIKKIRRMARHDKKHGREAPFASRKNSVKILR
jgi:tRNA A-37 threonylcarbamoyl transferase component Bud32